MASHFCFVRNHHKHIEKVGVVADSLWEMSLSTWRHTLWQPRSGISLRENVKTGGTMGAESPLAGQAANIMAPNPCLSRWAPALGSSKFSRSSVRRMGEVYRATDTRLDSTRRDGGCWRTPVR